MIAASKHPAGKGDLDCRGNETYVFSAQTPESDWKHLSVAHAYRLESAPTPMNSTQHPGELTVRVVDTSDEFLELRSDWDRLSGDVPFRDFRWHFAWWQCFRNEHALLILVIEDGIDCVGIAPLCVRRVLSVGRMAQFLGSGEIASDQQSFLSAPGRHADVGRCVAEWFSSAENTAADLLQLDGIDDSCATVTAFAEAANEMGYSLIDRSTVHTWRIELPDHIDEYVASLSKSCRRKIRKSLKRFDSGELAFSFADDMATLDTNWHHLVELHQRRRQSLGDSGCFHSASSSTFLARVAQRFFESGKLNLVSVLCDGRPIASELCFNSDTICYAYQIGVDPDSLDESPGWLVNAVSIRNAIERRFSHFDFCRGDLVYKRNLGAKPTACRRLRIVPPRLSSQVLNSFITNGSALKSWCQNAIGATHGS